MFFKKITKNKLLNPKEAVNSGKILGSCQDVSQSWQHIKITCRTQKENSETSSQHRGVGRYTLPPHTTKRRTRTNLKTKK